MIKIIAATAPDGEPKIAPPKPGQKPPAGALPNTVPDGMTASPSIPIVDEEEDQVPSGGELQGTPVKQIANPPAPNLQQQQPLVQPIVPGQEPMPQGMNPAEFDEITPEGQPAPEEPAQEAPEEQPFPQDEFEEITEETTELDRLNQTLGIEQKIDTALAEGYPLRIIYTTLKGHTTERNVRPDYYLPARTTGNWVLIAWCELRGDWRGFIVNRIRAAKLEPKNE